MLRRKVIGWLATVMLTSVSGWILLDLLRYGWITVAIIGNSLLLPMWTVAIFYLLTPKLRHPFFERYFTSMAWEQGGSLYLRFGVRQLQSMLEMLYRKRKGGFRVRRDMLFFEKMEYETRTAEAAHGLCFFVMIGLATYAAIIGSMAGMFWLIGAALAFQTPAVILQRYNRPRWQRMLRSLSMQAKVNRDEGSFSSIPLMKV
jgi:hypothetical protein